MVRAKTFVLLTPNGKFVQTLYGGVYGCSDRVGKKKPDRYCEADDLSSASVFTLRDLHPVTETTNGITELLVEDKVVVVTLIEAYVTRTVTIGIRPSED